DVPISITASICLINYLIRVSHGNRCALRAQRQRRPASDIRGPRQPPLLSASRSVASSSNKPRRPPPLAPIRTERHPSSSSTRVVVRFNLRHVAVVDSPSLWEPPTAALPGVKRTLSDPAAAVPNHHHQHHQQGPSAPKRPSFGGPQALATKARDPLFPSDCDNELSYALFREIINDLPVRLCRPKLSADAKKQLYRMLRRPRVAKIVKWNVEQTYQFLRQAKMPTYEDCLERLVAHLKRTCQPHIEEAAKESRTRGGLPPWSGDPSAEFAATRCRSARRHRGRQSQQQLVETGCTDRMQFVATGRDNSSQQGICRSVFAKLQQLYTLHCTEEDPSMEKFFPSSGYQAFLGQQSQNTQAALPIPVFEAISRLFGYCSAFPDTDCYFGSRGPVLDFYPLEGSFEANPPFSEELHGCYGQPYG
uniref:PCIF1_WW domain-containing protein n=1 Tax=Macrostomum lignano TaxID=282301 RepID=A0A1I8FAH7_9PLAT